MKKWYILLSAVLIAAAISGCAFPDNTDTETMPPAKSTVEKTAKKTESTDIVATVPATENTTSTEAQTTSTLKRKETTTTKKKTKQTATTAEKTTAATTETEQTTATTEPAEKRQSTEYTYFVKESAAKPRSYMDDAVFLGDSRTEGMIAYTGLSNATSYAKVSLSISAYFSKKYIKIQGVKYSQSEALRKISFSKVYMNFGINEISGSMSAFIKNYRKAVRDIQSINPSAIIYIQDIIPVTAAHSAKDKYENNTRIAKYNAALEQLAKEEGVYFLAISEALVDKNGCLPASSSKDGVHFGKNSSNKWLNYLLTHTVEE